VDHGPERVSTLECLRPGASFIRLGRDFPFLLFSSKRSHGLTDLAPRKALKTASVQAAGAISGPAAQPTLSQGAPPHGAQASHVPGEQVPEVGSSAEAAIVIGEAAGADAVPSPPAVSAMPASATTAVGTVPVGEHMVAAGVETAAASAPGASEEVGVDAQFIQAGGSLVAVRRSPEARGQLLRFRTREASDPIFILDDEEEDQSWDELRKRAEATVGSLRSSLEVLCGDVPKILQVTVSGIPSPFCERGVRRDAFFSFQDLTDRSAAKSSFIRREADVWGSLRSLRTSLAGATARLSQQDAKIADLQLLCADLRAEAAAARTEVLRQRSELVQVAEERDQSRG
jgi:hypothetical protein